MKSSRVYSTSLIFPDGESRVARDGVFVAAAKIREGERGEHGEHGSGPSGTQVLVVSCWIS